jgi:hypothetical protein
MKIYEHSTPRIASGLTAIAMSVLTLGVMVVLPAKFGSAYDDASAPPAGSTMAAGAAEPAAANAARDAASVAARGDADEHGERPKDLDRVVARISRHGEHAGITN